MKTLLSSKSKGALVTMYIHTYIHTYCSVINRYHMAVNTKFVAIYFLLKDKIFYESKRAWLYGLIALITCIACIINNA